MSVSVHFTDPSTPAEETLLALDTLVQQGKMRFLGCSHFSAWQLVDAVWGARHAGGAEFVSYHGEYHLSARGIESALIPD